MSWIGLLIGLAAFVSCAWGADQGASGTEFCAYLVDQQGRPQYMNGEALLVPAEGGQGATIRLQPFAFGKLGGWNVPAGSYDLLLKDANSVRSVRITYRPAGSARCEPKLLIRDRGTVLETEWHAAEEKWIDPQTEAFNTVKRFCGKFGFDRSRQAGDGRISPLSGVAIRVYKRVQGEPCCGDIVGEKRTDRSGRFDFSKLPNDRYWAVVKLDEGEYSIPLVVDSSDTFDACPALALSPAKGLEFWRTTTVN